MTIEEILKDEFDETLISENNSFFKNKVVLVTGAGGSIGQKLAQVLLSSSIKKLIILDNSEGNLFDLQQILELRGFTNFNIELADISCRETVARVFNKHKPCIVYHTAAYKHVPMLEHFPHEAFKVNVIGTKNIIDYSISFKTKHFVLISTDKAVYPKNVMGVTKRMAELYVSKLMKNDLTEIKIVRFGNIPNTTGSVLPLWKKQLKITGSITVVDPKMVRYFISLNKVCKMLLNIMTDLRGDLFIAEMGSAVNINALGILFLQKNNINPKNINYTEKRPGEKIKEFLVYPNEVKTKGVEYFVGSLVGGKNELDNLEKLINVWGDLKSEDFKIYFNKIISDYNPI